MHRSPDDDRHAFAQVTDGSRTTRGSRPGFLALGLIGFVAVGAVVAAIALRGPGGSTGSTGSTGVNVGQIAPQLAGTTLDGRSVSLADFRGRPVVVNFWASWCIPCRDEFPLFKQAESDHPELVFLGVVYQDDPGSAANFVAREAANWPSLTDPDGSRAKAYQVAAPPQSYFIDRDGIVRSRQIGEVSAADFERQYSAIAGPSSSPAASPSAAP